MPASTPPHAAALDGITVLERGWLSSNNVILHGAPGEGATLVDTGHCVHVAQTLALLREALVHAPLARVVNTHLHSDHCGANAALQRLYGMPVIVPAGGLDAVRRWDRAHLGFDDVGQRHERFTADGALAAGDTFAVGPTRWTVLAAPGHDPDAFMLHEASQGVLISGDALWQDGFGIVFPELDDRPAFVDVRATLDRIAALDVRCVIPGHGAPFTDVTEAIARARSRLAAFEADPARHARHAAKVLLKYHLMEEGSQPLAMLMDWATATPLLERVWHRLHRPDGSLAAWTGTLLGELQRSRALVLRDGVMHNA